jgi:hypothetical protein
MTDGEAQLTLYVLFKRLVKRPLPRTNRSSGMLPVTLLPVYDSRGMKTMKVRPMLATMSVAIGAPIAAKTNFITVKIRVMLMLGKMSKGQKRWCWQQKWIYSHGLKGSLMQKLMSKKMAIKVSV